MKSFFTRLISGIVLLAIIISTGIVGGPVLFGFTLLISLIGYWEFLQVFGLEKKAPGIWGMIFVVLYYGTVYMGEALNLAGPLLLVAFLMVLMGVYVVTFPKYKTDEITAPFFGLVYVALMLSFLYQTRMVPIGGKEYAYRVFPDLYLFLGLRYLRLCGGYARLEAQNGSDFKSEEIH